MIKEPISPIQKCHVTITSQTGYFFVFQKGTEVKPRAIVVILNYELFLN